MRAAGFSTETLGADYDAAATRVEQFNSEWDEIRHLRDEGPEQRGDFSWLINQFEKDPTWYLAKARRTIEEIDYAFKIINQKIGFQSPTAVSRRHCRALYNQLRVEGSVHKARKIMKWFVRLMEYAVEIGVRDDNPAIRLKMEKPPGRNQVWTPAEVEAVVKAALAGGRARGGNAIPARPSIALATLIAYDTSLPEQDVLALKWEQFDGQGLTVKQKKPRGEQKELWTPLSKECLSMMKATVKTSLFIIVSEQTAQPYPEQGIVFSRLHRRFRRRAGIRKDLTFQDLRRTALTELGNTGSTNAQIVSISGHDIASNVLKDYVKPDKQAALEAARKRWQNDE